MALALALALLAAALGLGGCAVSAPPVTVLEGETMGSAWTVKIAGALPAPQADLQRGVQGRFDAVNQALSTWRKDSALSQFNAHPGDDWVDVDPELVAVLAFALELAERSDGAYDVTVGPLVNLWGFGPDPASHQIPDAAAVAAARARVGWRKVQLDVAARRARKAPGVYVDLSSLGKGRGVDRVAEYLDTQGVTNYLIDLSGKLRGRGHNPAGKPWSVAVEQPAPDDPGGAPRTVEAVVRLLNDSVATAGDYRRFFETGGKHYSHIIDPRSGAPVAHGTVSATVLAASCMEADALATMYMVMPPVDALRLADQRGEPALLISRDAAGFRLQPSRRWPER